MDAPGQCMAVAGVADPGYSCNGKYIWAGHALKHVSVNRIFSADVSCYIGSLGRLPQVVDECRAVGAEHILVRAATVIRP